MGGGPQGGFGLPGVGGGMARDVVATYKRQSYVLWVKEVDLTEHCLWIGIYYEMRTQHEIFFKGETDSRIGRANISRPPTLEIRPEKQKIRLNSDPFLTKNQTKFRLIWE